MSSVLAKRALVAHPDFPEPSIAIGAKLTSVGIGVLKIEYAVTGAVTDIRFPAVSAPERQDGLWKTTCFEAFVGMADGHSYVEYNFSPSRGWASYRFDDYRSGMAEAIDLSAPDIYLETDNGGRFMLTAWVDLTPLTSKGVESLGISAVIEEVDGRKSYWALAHPPGKPDFHHSDCFVLKLPAAV